MGERFGSGDGERKTLLTRQTAFEPLPASVLFGLGWWVHCFLKVDLKALHESATKVATLGSMPMKGRA